MRCSLAARGGIGSGAGEGIPLQPSRYITMRRKSELAANLGLTERQGKLWFQSRRAKERQVNKKQQQSPLPTHDVTPTPAGPPLGGLCPCSASLLGASSPKVPVKEEHLP
ncbi:Homeobox protein CDX-1, partial [Eschrichtius robustus]|nr:Homeobox protein CDX-1 [Eschrichtius robustus]